MIFHRSFMLALAVFWFSACTTPTTPPPTLAVLTLAPDQYPTSQTASQSMGGGEPRSTGYWLIWNTCAEGNQAESARANGGRDAGWILMDDLLADPGILIGVLQVETCEQGVHLLQVMSSQGVEMKNDPAYALAAQLITAQLNLAVGSEYCPASDQAVSRAQLLLLELKFNGTGRYLGPPLVSANLENAIKLTEELTDYNSGSLCVP